MRIKEALETAHDELIVQRENQYLNIPSLMGGVGIGKTEGARSLCLRLGEENNDQMMFEPIAVGESGDPTDTMGLPWIVPVEGEATKQEYKVLWALNTAALKACTYPTMLLFDDLDKATRIVTNALLKLFVERSFKDFKMHPDSVIMCAGNRAGDDIHAGELSESLKTRVTVIEVEPNVEDLTEWAFAQAPDPEHPLIHPMILGWLPSKPELIHKPSTETYRFPTPRGYREATMHMYRKQPDHWRAVLSRKIGEPATNDFFVWYDIYRIIDVEYILDNGTVKTPFPTRKDVAAEVTQKMGEFASVFAVAQKLNQKITPQHKGLERWIDSLSPELRVAFRLQLNKKTADDFGKFYAKSAGLIMSTIIKGA